MIQFQHPRTLTPRQREVLSFIVECIREGSPPSYEDLCHRFGIKSKNGVAAHIHSLTRHGYLTWTPHRAYGIEVLGLEVRVEYADTPAGHRLKEAIEGADE